MIRHARDLARGGSNPVFEVADAERLPFGDGEFTSVLCLNSFHHFPNPAVAMAEMVRVLASGGRLVLGDACSDLLAARVADVVLRRLEPGHVRLYCRADLGRFLYDAGLTNVRVRSLAGGGFAVLRGSAP